MIPSRTSLEFDFPAAEINRAAEAESWRKEVHRPASHTHKWWAQRLGTVFRGLLIGSLTPDSASASSAFSGKFDASGAVVYDPFAGSGTTLVEALKMGCKAIGQDINPVATLVQRQSVAEWDVLALDQAFAAVEATARDAIDELHITETGETVLYYFWVAQASCPECATDEPPIDLFSTRIFAKHAYAKKYPRAQASCPNCHAVVIVDAVADETLTCGDCGKTAPLAGPVAGPWMTCRQGHRSKVTASLGGHRPSHRMYAKLVLGSDGTKRYEPITDFDLDLYDRASKLLVEHRDKLVLPVGMLEDGYNTRQAIGWGFTRWEDFFNDRQLYCLGLLGAAIQALPESPEREALATLFSGTLEFNNLFCSFKGEGTGAVRHMFSHHILKPERVPLEAHPWGTPASSGSFSTLYKSRIIRALDYKMRPHDIVGKERVYGISRPLSVPVFTDAASLFSHEGAAAMITTGSSTASGLPSKSVDLVLTDPPFFDNVHYSELADFFHAWLTQLHPYDTYPAIATTRAKGEVQHTEADEFGNAIAAVWRESARVLKDEGLLAFTFHQSKPQGWSALVKALKSAGLVVTAIQPVKAEMSTSSTKSGASDPSNLDSVVVCRRRSNVGPPTVERARALLQELIDEGTQVGFSDVQSVIRGTVMSRFTWEDADLAELTTVAVEAANNVCLDLGVLSRRSGVRRSEPARS